MHTAQGHSSQLPSPRILAVIDRALPEKILRNRCLYSCFANEETEAQGDEFTFLNHIVSGRTGF